LFVNNAGKLTPHYRRFLVDKIRAGWGFTGCPVLLELKERERRLFVKSSPGHRRVEKK
jgi:predicted GTPase